MVIHAIERCRERYGVDLTRAQYAALEQQITDHQALRSYTHGDKSVWIVRLPTGQAARAVVKDTKIITFLPMSHSVEAEAIGKHMGRKARNSGNGFIDRGYRRNKRVNIEDEE